MHRLPLTALLAAIVASAACRQQEAANNAAATEEPSLRPPPVPRPQPPIDRAALLAAVAEAASAAAAGTPMPQAVLALDGRQFEVRIRFGCRGPTTDLDDQWLGWSFDPDSRRIRVRAAPTISKEEPVVARIGDDEFEAVEGFWLPRPWLLQAVCPAGVAVTAAAEGEPAAPQEATARGGSRTVAETAEPEQNGESLLAPPRIGIAQFFTSEDPRTRRRDTRPYQASHVLAEGAALSPQGYNLVLSGRLRRLPGSGVIHCVPRGPDAAPDCIISAEFLRVWIEQPDTRDVIAEWGAG